MEETKEELENEKWTLAELKIFTAP